MPNATANAGETLMADTINTGTTLTEESALIPESLRFESEPWTFFYVTGEIIRELEEALGNEAGTGNAPEPLDDHRRDGEASSLDEDGYPPKVPQPYPLRRDTRGRRSATPSR
jgi:hypothetical protein